MQMASNSTAFEETADKLSTSDKAPGRCSPPYIEWRSAS
jgi:hypothetical protein